MKKKAKKSVRKIRQLKNDKLIIAFDLDGTLIDSAPDLCLTLNKVLCLYNIKSVNEKVVRDSVGQGAKKLIELALSHNKVKEHPLIEEMKEKFLKVYKNNCTVNTQLFPNALSILKSLSKDYRLILISNKPEYFVKKILNFFNINCLFEAVSGGDTFKYRKPDIRHLTLMLEKIGGEVSKCIFVGDSVTDVKFAYNAKIPIIFTSFGYNSISYEKLNPQFLIKDLSEIPLILKKLS